MAGHRQRLSRRLAGRIVDVVSLVGLAVPNFWLALLLVELFAVRLGCSPPTGYVPLTQDPAGLAAGIALPVITLSAGADRVRRQADPGRDGRGHVGGVRRRCCAPAGCPRRSIVCKHALRNAAIPVVTVSGLLLVSLLSGTVLVESVFSLPGLGGQAVQASGSHDLPVIPGSPSTSPSSW